MTSTSKLSALALAAALALASDAQAQSNSPRARAEAAQARGDLRAAQLELRNAIRADPNQAALRLALARVSLDMGDAETAEREAKAALERGGDGVEGTSLLVRAMLARGRMRELLNELPAPAAGTPPAVAAQVLVGRALASFAIDDREGAARAIEEARRLAPEAPEVVLAASSFAVVNGDRAGGEAMVDALLARQPDHVEGLLRKGAFQLERGDVRPGLENYSRAITLNPGDVSARLRRAEVLLRTGENDRARADLDAAVAVQPNNAVATFLRASLQVATRDWAAADATLQRLGPALPQLPGGLLLQATVKRALGQNGQAEDAARRHVARFPEDPRGAKLLASMEIEANQLENAAATLGRAATPTATDPELFDMLGRVQTSLGRRREAVTAFEAAARLVPQDSGVQTRLSVARLAAGDAAGSQGAAEESLRLGPSQRGAREMLIASSLARGDLDGASAELERLDPAARSGQVGALLDGTIRLMRFDLAGARRVLETALRGAPDNASLRVTLARVAALEQKPDEEQRLLGEALQREPANTEVLSRLSGAALVRGPAGDAALATLTAAQAARPDNAALALTLARVLLQRGQAANAATLLEGEPLTRQRNATLALARSEAQAAAEQWQKSEASARAALAEEPNSPGARRQLARLLLRGGDARGAETLLSDGLRAAPGDPVLQQALVGVILESQGIDAALAAADRIAAQPSAMPAASILRGDLLLGARRPAEAAAAYGDMMNRAPSGVLALRQATALRAANRNDEATAVLTRRLAAAPQEVGLLSTLAQYDIAANRLEAAEGRLRILISRAPEDAVSLNNLAWIITQRRGNEGLAEAKGLAQRAFFLAPSAEAADTLGWILARSGELQPALALLRQAAAALPQPGIVYHLAWALNAYGDKAEARRVLEPALAAHATFAERAEAERLMADLRR
jgi:putative PEP-CTERM system TPR-repeat lipoprotein